LYSQTDKKTESLKWLRSSALSILLHIVGFFIIAFLANMSIESALVNPVFYSVEFNEFIKSAQILEKEELIDNDPEELSNPADVSASQNFSFRDINADTTNLDQVYKENTLNVSIKYPRGWTFIDQNVKNKLDGVTFWASDGLYDPPPYIHIEVKEKYYFNEQKYQNQLEFKDFIAYFNEPEIIEDYYIQNVYLRTETGEDFNIKLIIVGEEAFKSFQPRFFGMIKTFNFGSTFF
jgi:hypothetical protein